MNLSEYISNHPDRLRYLDSSEKFFETCGLDPIYIDSKRNLIDVMTLSAFIALHGGRKLRDEMKAMVNYLKSKNLRHADDSAERYSEAFEEIKAAYKADRKTYPDRTRPDDPWPFFVRPETAFGFMRHQLANSDETYGMQLEPSASIVPQHARGLILAAFNNWKKENYLAWYLAVADVSMKMQTRRLETPEGTVEHTMEVYVYVPRSQPKHARLELTTDAEGSPLIPTLRELVRELDEAGVLPGFEHG